MWCCAVTRYVSVSSQVKEGGAEQQVSSHTSILGSLLGSGKTAEDNDVDNTPGLLETTRERGRHTLIVSSSVTQIDENHCIQRTYLRKDTRT